MTDSRETDEDTVLVWYICNICNSRAYKNPKDLFKHKILCQSPQNNENENKCTSKKGEKSNIKVIGGVNETILKFTEIQRKMHLETIVNSLEDKSNSLIAGLTWNSNNRSNLILGDDSSSRSTKTTTTTKKTRKNPRRPLSNARSAKRNKLKAKNNSLSHSCKTCSAKFGTKFTLIIHERVHSGERPFTCQFQGCDYAGISKWYVTRHQRLHEAGRILLCHRCKIYFKPVPSSKMKGDDQLMNRCKKCS